MAGEETETSSSPSISIRQYIRWLPDTVAEEPTSTLVLTTSRSNYVDTRILLPIELQDTSILPDPQKSSQLDLSHLDWAFAGTSSSTYRTRRSSTNSAKNDSSSVIKPLTPADESRGDKDKRDVPSSHARSGSGGKILTIRECTWTHWVDSRGPVAKHTHSDSRPPSGVQSPTSPITPDDWTDTGTIYPTEKDNESLEKGRMLNDEGIMQDMEELWRDFAPQKLPGENKVTSIALTAENKVLGTKGMVIRVGGWCQGIIRSSNGEIGIERWRFGSGGLADGLVRRYDDSSERVQEGRWQKIFKLGNMSLPCESACIKSYDMQEGDSITHGGLKWSVIEKELV